MRLQVAGVAVIVVHVGTPRGISERGGRRGVVIHVGHPLEQVVLVICVHAVAVFFPDQIAEYIVAKLLIAKQIALYPVIRISDFDDAIVHIVGVSGRPADAGRPNTW